MLGFEASLWSKDIKLKSLYCYMGFTIKTITVPLRRQPVSTQRVFIRAWLSICTRFLDFSKIADLQARSAALGAAL